MLRLFILRHAQSGWANAGQKDIERTLSDHGINQLSNIGELFVSMNYQPQKVLCSDATRTNQTFDGIAPYIQSDFDKENHHDLYNGEVDTYFSKAKAQQTKGDLLFVGHNPMCAGFALQLIGDGEPKALSQINTGYPSGSLCVIEFDIESWSDLRLQTGYLRHFHLT